MILLIPAVQQIVRMDLRTVVLDVPTQDVISRDKLNADIQKILDAHTDA